ncbi:MAG: hypothetical protein E7647_07850 [Ruminococcaceae bacterium]|nr:hypothetical protein [Oscillospiraceae bacterium]
MQKLTKDTLLLEAGNKTKSSRDFFSFMIFVTLFWIICWGMLTFFTFGAWGLIPLITGGGIGVAITILAYKGLTKSNARYKSVEKEKFYIKAKQITAHREDEDSEGVRSYYICFSDGEELYIGCNGSNELGCLGHKGFNVGDTVYVVYMSDSNKHLCFYNANIYELESDIADKLIKS